MPKKTGSKQAFWRQHIEDCCRSPLTQNAYCREHGLALSTFSYWKRRAKARGKETPRFYPLMTVKHGSPQNPQVAKSGLSLQFGEGKFRIELEETFFSAACLKKLILTLEQL